MDLFIMLQQYLKAMFEFFEGSFQFQYLTIIEGFADPRYFVFDGNLRFTKGDKAE